MTLHVAHRGSDPNHAVRIDMLPGRRRTPFSIWVGFDPREAGAFAVTRQSLLSCRVPVTGLVLDRLRRDGLYWRPTEKRGDILYDVISEHPMATQFSISRFLVPQIARRGWALFMDCDMMVMPDADLYELFLEVERTMADKAIVCVKHDHQPAEGLKMDGQVQTAYSRKNWSSFCFFHVDHPANSALTLEMVNSVPGRDLHAFSWLGNREESEPLIGELSPAWNWLVGHSDAKIIPRNVHWTEGVPLMRGYEDVAYADEFRERLYDWAQGSLSLTV